MASETSLTPTINTLYGKKWTSFGDSITARESWQKYVADKFGLIHTNSVIGSSCVSGKGETAFWQDTRLIQALTLASVNAPSLSAFASDLLCHWDERAWLKSKLH